MIFRICEGLSSTQFSFINHLYFLQYNVFPCVIYIIPTLCYLLTVHGMFHVAWNTCKEDMPMSHMYIQFFGTFLNMH